MSTTRSGSVLVVEDELLVAMHVESVLADLGFHEVSWAGSLKTAERAVHESAPAFAILDVNLGSELVFPLAQKLRQLKVPFLFSSGGASLPPEWTAYPFVPKPLRREAIATVLEGMGIDIPARQRVTTLGDVLYADGRFAPPEKEWRELVNLVAAGDHFALHRLYERAHHPVLVLCARNSGSLEAAEDLALDVFHEVWRRASTYDEQSVLGWIMRLARERASERVRFQNMAPASAHAAGASPAALDPRENLVGRLHCDTDRSQARLALRIAIEQGRSAVMAPQKTWREPDWDAVAPGIECKLLAADTDAHRISMLVRLAPDASYPPHRHAGSEELHLLDGELWIDDRKLYPGDYNYGAAGDGDDLVWSETGCCCVLMTSTKDVLR